MYYSKVEIRHRASTEHSLVFRIRCYVVIATKPVHRLQIRHGAQLEGTSYHSPVRYIGVSAVMWECGEGQTHRRA